jgi:DNA-binding MarR family transcriptional regulator
MARILKALRVRDTMLRSELMNNYHLSAKDADVLFSTLEQRGLIDRQKHGKTERISLTAVGGTGG